MQRARQRFHRVKPVDRMLVSQCPAHSTNAHLSTVVGMMIYPNHQLLSPSRSERLNPSKRYN